MTRRHRSILWLILIFEAAIRFAIIVNAGPMTDQGFYGDDSFMSHQFAATIAAGGGITQADRPTNGFQPLFVFLLVPVYWLCDHHQATVASAVMTSLFSIVGSYLLFRLLHILFNPRVGLIGLGLWANSAYLTRVGLNGLETSLANMLMLLVLCLHLTSVRAADRPVAWKAVVSGLVMGLAVLARMDLGLLVATAGLDQIRVHLVRRQYRPLVAIAAAGTAVILPWFAWSRIACGSFMPVSGQATRTIAQLYGSPTGPSNNPDYFPLGEVPAAYYASSISQAIRELVVHAPLSGPAVALAGIRTDVASVWLAVVIIAAVAGSASLKRAASLGQSMRYLFRRLWFAWAFLPMLLGAYCFFYFAQWHFWRYLTPLVILLILPSALLIDRLWEWFSQGPRGVRRAGILCIILAAGVAGIGHLALFNAPDATGIARRLYHDAIYLRDHLEPDARMGSFESGTLDYFLGRDVYNLDGKTNARALRALNDGRMDLLLAELKLDYVVSSPFLIRDLLDRRGRWKEGELRFVRRLSHVDVIAVARDPEVSEPR